MPESLIFLLLLSTALGFLSGLGVGGGSLLILWLTIVRDVPQTEARNINLLFFVPSALIACLFRWRQGCLKPKILFPAILSGCICAAVFSFLAVSINTVLLRKLFGILLLLTGLRELLYKPKKIQRSD